jgi:apolipoprotein N-acyltransferase
MKYFAPYGPNVDYDIRPGEKMTRFQLRDFRFGALICFEDSDAALARQYAQTTTDGKPVDFFVNISNDGWFADTSEHEEHLIVSLFRAIENRRSLVRSVNQGISAVIDSNGRIMKPRPVPLEEPDTDHPPQNRMLARAQKEWEEMRLWQQVAASGAKNPADAIHAWEILPDEDTRDFGELSPAEYASYKNNCGVLFSTVRIDHRVSLYSQWGDWLPIGCWTVGGAVVLMSVVSGRRHRVGWLS